MLFIVKTRTNKRRVDDITRAGTGRILFAMGRGKQIAYVLGHIRWGKIILVALSCAVVVGVIAHSRIARSQNAVFYPSSCLGGWENPNLAEGKPDTDDGAAPEAFTAANSAVLRNKLSQIFCGSFIGDMPQGTTTPVTAVIRLSFVSKDQPQEFMVPLPLGTSTGGMINQEFPITASSSETFPSPTPGIAQTSEPTPTASPPGISPAPTVTPEAVQPSASSTPVLSPETFPAPTPISEIVQPVESPVSWWQYFVKTALAEEIVPTTTPMLLENTPAISIEPSPAVSFSPVSVSTSTVSEQIPMSPEPAVSNVPEPSLVATTTPISSVSDAAIPEALWEVLYTFDGTNWEHGTYIRRQNTQPILFTVPGFTWDMLASLSVSVQSLQTASEVPGAYLDGMRLEVDYAKSDIILPAQDEIARLPFMSKPSYDAIGTSITVPVSLKSIQDIDGCDPEKCTYWQMHFEQQVGDSYRYYSSDAYPAEQLKASYTFILPPGVYTRFILAGYQGSAAGNCGASEDGMSDTCPDGKHITDIGNGLKVIDDPEFIPYPLMIPHATTTPALQ